ncbi:MinD/ParA family ATP-binding protein [Mycobacterium kyorinense]|uniref:MinD/ParA family ATP-binding protein n=1 Tax=Mycobacterium kyorinense TaxID=487514 RepID=UPI000B0F2ED6|nr:AAA family ATPase [Mycobacterium kyorinense]
MSQPRDDTPTYRPPSPADTRATVPVIRAQPPVVDRPAPSPVAPDSRPDHDTPAPAKRDWRSLLVRLTPTDSSPGKTRTDEPALRTRIRASVDSPFPIAVLNLKGGVGKTVVVEALGSTFADARDDHVLAADLDAGGLADRHGHRNSLNLVDLLADRSVTQYPDLRAHTYQNSAGLEVLGIPDYAYSDWRIDRDHVVKAFSLLRQHYSVMLIDCGRDLKSGVTEAVLREARALVVVTSASVDAIKKTRTTMQWLANNEYRKLIEATVLAVNHTEPGKPGPVVSKELQQLAGRFPSERVVELPFDRHVHEGKEITLQRLSRESRRRYLQMAASLADLFPTAGDATTFDTDFR